MTLKRSGRLARKTRLRSSGRIKPNAKRAKKTYAHNYGSKARVEFVKSLPCAACYVVGYSENAHVLGNGGKGRKKDSTTIAPLCGPRGDYIGCHRMHDRRYGEFVVQWPTWDAATVAKRTEELWQQHLNTETDMALVDFARDEMQRAGLYDADADYNGSIAKAVERLVEVFAEQGHSGASAHLTLDVFEKVARFKPLTPITSDPIEWSDISEYSGGPMWQSKRSPSVFSKDGGETWYDIDVPKAD